MATTSIVYVGGAKGRRGSGRKRGSHTSIKSALKSMSTKSAVETAAMVGVGYFAGRGAARLAGAAGYLDTFEETNRKYVRAAALGGAGYFMVKKRKMPAVGIGLMIAGAGELFGVQLDDMADEQGASMREDAQLPAQTGGTT